MSLPQFEYFEPKTLKEACNLLSQNEGARVLAGGTDLLVEMKDGGINPPCIIDLKGIEGLDSIDYDSVDGLRIGPLVTIRTIETAPIIKEKYPILYQAAHVFASVQIRNRATIGGNICHAIPSADTPPPLIALGATLRIMGVEGERKVGIEEFFTGFRKNDLDGGELLTRIDVPPMPKEVKGVYLKHTLRRAMDLAIVGAAVLLEKENGNGRCKDIRIALASVAPTPIRAKRAEEVLRGQEVTEKAVINAAEVASEDIKPRRGSFRSSPVYRRGMVKIFVKRAILKAMNGI